MGEHFEHALDARVYAVYTIAPFEREPKDEPSRQASPVHLSGQAEEEVLWHVGAHSPFLRIQLNHLIVELLAASLHRGVELRLQFRGA